MNTIISNSGYMLTFVVCPQLLGTPTDADIGLVKNEDARRYIRQLPQYPRQPLNRVFPHVHPLAIDLVDKMLTVDPTRRITGNLLILTSHSFMSLELNKANIQVHFKH